MAQEPDVKVMLHNDGEDVETVWAEPCGSHAGAGLFRLVNVPFLHAKPTYGDIIAAVPDAAQEHPRVWNRSGAPFEQLGERIHQDGGRYAAIVDYVPELEPRFEELSRWLEHERDVIPEGCYGPGDDKPGRLYLAVREEVEPPVLFAALRERFGEGLTWVHPALDGDEG